MSDNRCLIVAVEGTAALERHWKSIMSDYLEKIIRSFAGNGLAGQKSSSSGAEFALIQFNAPGKSNPYIVQTSGWTKNVDTFMELLSTIHFHGDGVRDVALSEGIAKALMKFPTATNGSKAQQEANVEKHCILVAASNPARDLPDAESIAKDFPKVPASLSVISPKQLPRLRAIYDAAKPNPSSADPAVDNGKNPNFLVLISENFMEACQALSCPPDIAVEGPHRASISAGTSRQVRAEMQPIGVNSTSAANTRFPRQTSRHSLANDLGSSGPSPATGTMIMIPTPGMPRQVRAGMQLIGVNNTSAANTQFPQQTYTHNLMSGLGSSGPSPAMGRMMMIPTPGMPRQVRAGMQSIGVNNTSAANTQFPQQTYTHNLMSGLGSFGPSPAMGRMMMIPTPGMARQVQAGMQSIGVNNTSAANTQLPQQTYTHNLMSGLGSSGPSLATGTMIPTRGIPRQVQTLNLLQLIGVNNTSAASTQLPQQTSSILISTHLPYVKTWEGKLYARLSINQQLLFVANLEGHRSSLASAMFTANWPSTIHMVSQISLDHINYELIKHHVENASFLVFRASEHRFLLQLQESNYCAVIPLLSSQTMVFLPTDRPYRLIGVVFPWDVPELNRQLSSLQQQHRQQQHRQQRVETGTGNNQYEAVGTPSSSTNNQRPEWDQQRPPKMPRMS